MSCTPLPKATKPVWAKQLTRLPCPVVYVKFQFAYTIMHKLELYSFLGCLLDASINSLALITFNVSNADVQSNQNLLKQPAY